MAKVEVNNYVTQQTPRWMGDYTGREHQLAGGVRLDPTQFFAEDSVLVTASAAAAGATSVTVTALSGAIPSGTVLDFGTTKFARLTAAAAAGATTLTVAALPTALAGGETARYAGTGYINVLSGTPIGRTFAERDAGTQFGPGVSTDDEFYLICFDINDVVANPDADPYRPQSLVKENYIPGWASMSAPLQAKIRAVYQTTKGGE